jgi:hypothetical protein
MKNRKSCFSMQPKKDSHHTTTEQAQNRTKENKSVLSQQHLAISNEETYRSLIALTKIQQQATL